MVRDFINFIVQKKYLVMLITSVIYILGLFAYFSGSGIFFAGLLLAVSLFVVAKNYLSPKLVLFWYFIFFFGFFNASLRIKDSDALFQIAPQEAVIEGQVVSIPQGDESRQKFFVEVKKVSYLDKVQNVDAKTLVNVTSSSPQASVEGARGKNIITPNFNIGNTYKFKGKLRTPLEVSNPSQLDYRKYLKNFGVFTVFYADGSDCAQINTKLTFKWKFLQGLNNIRNDIMAAHSKCLKSPNLEILGGIVFGDDAVSPPDEIKNSFKNSGLLHILAASGMNVALIYGIWFFILKKLRAPFNFTVSSGIFVVIFYAMMTGLGASVMRAMFMLIFILIGKLIDRDAHSVSLLSFVALLMLIYNPAFINDVGFQLSFLVTFGLLITAPILFEKTSNPSPRNLLDGVGQKMHLHPLISGAIFIPLIAQIWVAPIQMFYFNSFSLYSIFANIAIMPFVTIISFGGFVSSVLAIIKPIANSVCFVFDFVLNPVLNILVAISNYFSSLPHSLIQTFQPEIYQIFLYYAIVLLITLLIKIKDYDNSSLAPWGRGIEGEGYLTPRKLFITVIILIVLLALSCIELPNDNLETIFFDVGNADAILIKTPKSAGEKYFLIDSGKTPFKKKNSLGKTQAQMIILAYLKDKGIKNIEGLILTHFDSDHAGGAVDLIKNLNINKVYVNSLKDQSPLPQQIYANAKLKNTPLQLVKNNEIIFNNGDFVIRNFVSGINDDNENSVITLISDGNFDELYMGDAGVEAFNRVKKYLPEQVEILKVGHHGAKNVLDKAFLERIKPDAAVISTGINNYGHPNGVTLELLKRNHVKIFRTDRKHSIKIVKNNDKYMINSFSKGKYVVNFVKTL